MPGSVVEGPGTPTALDRLATVIRSVGHPVRLRLLSALRDRERTVTELQDATGEEQATVSRQLAVMRARRIVASRRDGVNVYYRIAEPRVHAILDCARGIDDVR